MIRSLDLGGVRAKKRVMEMPRKATAAQQRASTNVGLDAKEIGARIAKSRRELDGMTQRELADLVEVTERSVAAWELGENIPFRHMSKLGQILGREVSWLLYGDDHAPQDLQAQLERIFTKLEDIERRLAVRKL
jgi:transcriptional regulator with XRE-family HTH domain